jgi:hypothetical protein
MTFAGVILSLSKDRAQWPTSQCFDKLSMTHITKYVMGNLDAEINSA